MDLILTLAAPPATEAPPTISVWEFVLKGGFMMIPIGICSLVALTVIVERAVVLSRGSVVPPGFVAGLRKILDGGTLEHRTGT